MRTEGNRAAQTPAPLQQASAAQAAKEASRGDATPATQEPAGQAVRDAVERQADMMERMGFRRSSGQVREAATGGTGQGEGAGAAGGGASGSEAAAGGARGVARGSARGSSEGEGAAAAGMVLTPRELAARAAEMLETHRAGRSPGVAGAEKTVAGGEEGGGEVGGAAAAGGVASAGGSAPPRELVDRLGDWIDAAVHQGASFSTWRSARGLEREFGLARRTNVNGGPQNWGHIQGSIDRALVGERAVSRDDLRAAIRAAVDQHPEFAGHSPAQRERLASGLERAMDAERTHGTVRAFRPRVDEALAQRLHETVGPDFSGGTPAERAELVRDIEAWARGEMARLEESGVGRRDPGLMLRRQEILTAAVYASDALRTGLDCSVPTSLQERWTAHMEANPGDFAGAVERLRPQMRDRMQDRLREALRTPGLVQGFVEGLRGGTAANLAEMCGV